MWRRPPGAVWNGDRPMVSLKPMVGAARRMVECDRENDGRRLFTATAARSVCVPAPPGYHPVSSNRDTHGTKNSNISVFWRSVCETHARKKQLTITLATSSWFRNFLGQIHSLVEQWRRRRRKQQRRWQTGWQRRRQAGWQRRAWFHADLHVWLAFEVDVSNERKERGHELGHELCSISGPSFAVRRALAVFAPIP